MSRESQRAKGTGSVYQLGGSRFWWISYMSGGKRYSESSKSERKKDAQDLLTSRLGEIGRGVGVTPHMGRFTLKEGLQAVADDLQMNTRKSAHETERRMRYLLDYFGEGRKMNSITTADVERYKKHRLDEKAAAATINRELASLRRAYRLAVRGGKLVSATYVGLLRENNARKFFFERKPFEAILSLLPERYHAPLRFAYITGWRFRSEVLSLTVAQVDLKAGFVRLEVGTTKSGEGRMFYLTQDLRKLLEAQVKSLGMLKKRGIISPYVFHEPDGAAIPYFIREWREACQDAGYPHMWFHDLRRTAVRNLERAAVPRSTAMQMVGHKTESIYRRYAIVDEAMHREGAAKLDAWAKLQAKSDDMGQVKQFKKATA